MRNVIIGICVISIILFLVGCEQEKVEIVPEPLPQPIIEEKPRPETEIVEQPVEETTEAMVNTIKIVGNEFEPAELTIKVGEKVVWENTRTGNVKKAIIKGTKQCVFLQSPTLESGETFEWTFTEPGTCQFIEAVTSINTGKVIVEE